MIAQRSNEGEASSSAATPFDEKGHDMGLVKPVGVALDLAIIDW